MLGDDARVAPEGAAQSTEPSGLAAMGGVAPVRSSEPVGVSAPSHSEHPHGSCAHWQVTHT